MVIRREEVETTPEFVPERHTIEDDPAHDFGALPHVGLFRPHPVFRIWYNPKTEVAFAVVDLVDDFDYAGIGARHHFRPGRQRNSRNAVKQNFDFPPNVQQRGVDAVGGHLDSFVETAGGQSDDFIALPHGFPGSEAVESGIDIVERDLLAVLVSAGEESDGRAPLLEVALHHVGDDRRVVVADVRAGKVIELDLTETDPGKARAQAEDMARKLLANTVIESFKVDVA